MDRAGRGGTRRARAAGAALALAMAAAQGVASPPQQPIVVQGLDCRGDDGGWRLDANRASALYAAQLPRKREVVFRGTLQTLSLGASAAIVWRGDSTHLPRETLVLTAREEACRAPVAGASHRAVLSIRPGEAASGCCSVRAGYDARVAPVANLAAKASGDWSRNLNDLLPAINLCITREGAKFASVAFAQAAAPGTVRVRMQEIGGAAIECTANAKGRGAPALVPAPGGAPAPAGAGNPLFYPPREPAPIVACGRLERVHTARGSLAGYLHYEPC